MITCGKEMILIPNYAIKYKPNIIHINDDNINILSEDKNNSINNNTSDIIKYIMKNYIFNNDK